MRVLLLNANWSMNDAPLAVDTVKPPVAPPIEFAYLASSFASRADVAVCDAYVRNLSREEIGRAVENFAPDWIVMSTAPSMLYWRCPPLELGVPRRTVKLIRQVSAARVVLIGPHGTVSPQWTLNQTGADFVFLGSPEIALAEAISTPGGIADSHLASSTRGGQPATVSARDLPRMNFSVFDFSLPYQPHVWNVDVPAVLVDVPLTPAVLAESSRGCPYRCQSPLARSV